MKFLCTIPNVKAFDEIKTNAEAIMVTNSRVSTRYDYSFSYEEIDELLQKCKKAKIELFLLINGIFSDENIKDAYEFIAYFKDTKLFYIFSDLGVYEILKEFNLTKRGIYNPDTLITNYLDFDFWVKQKIKGLFPSVEIPVKDIETLGKNKKVQMFYKGFGIFTMFHSKRNLLSTYKNYKNILFDYCRSNQLYLIEETRNEKYKIIENEHGTQIMQTGIHNVLPALDYFASDLDYLFLDGTYLDWQKYLSAVEIFKDALFDMDRLNYYNDKLSEVFDNLTYQFLYEDSIFKKGDF